MRHAFVDRGDKTMCSRCGNEVFRVDEECPAISDGEIYKSANPVIKCGWCGQRFDTISERNAHLVEEHNA